MKKFVTNKLNIMLFVLIFILLIAFFALKISPKNSVSNISIKYLEAISKGDYKKALAYTDKFADGDKLSDEDELKYEIGYLDATVVKGLNRARLLISNPLSYEEDGLEKARVYYNYFARGNKNISSGYIDLYKENGKWIISAQ